MNRSTFWRRRQQRWHYFSFIFISCRCRSAIRCVRLSLCCMPPYRLIIMSWRQCHNTPFPRVLSYRRRRNSEPRTVSGSLFPLYRITGCTYAVHMCPCPCCLCMCACWLRCLCMPFRKLQHHVDVLISKDKFYSTFALLPLHRAPDANLYTSVPCYVAPLRWDFPISFSFFNDLCMLWSPFHIRLADLRSQHTVARRRCRFHSFANCLCISSAPHCWAPLKVCSMIHITHGLIHSK